MKRLILLFAIFSAMLFGSCQGDPGPAGPPGTNIESEVFEVTTTFVPNTNPELTYRSFFDLNPAILASDNILVYELAGVQNGLDIWKLLPQVYTFGPGEIMQFNYDFTRNDFSIFVDSNFDLSTLSLDWFTNRTFRIVIIPGFFSNKGGVGPNHNDYYETLSYYGISDNNVVHLKQIR